VDTSYLLELLSVPKNSTESAKQEVKRRFKEATEQGALFFVALPCVFEVGNHIVDVDDGNKRFELANRFAETIAECIQTNRPWTVTPSIEQPDLPALFKAYATDYAKQKIGLTDACTIAEAKRLNVKYLRSLGYLVHIWCKDQALKAREPDPEPNPFVFDNP
jgi:predicted nucleic acid-binding protein